MQGRVAGASVAFASVPAGPAGAECIGPQCGYGLGLMIGTVAAYLVVAVVLAVMLVRARSRRVGFLALVAVALAVVGVPLASQGWQSWKLRAMEGREIARAPPAMRDRVPLLVTELDNSTNEDWRAVLAGRGDAGTYIVPMSAFAGLDLTGPVALADLPLEVWTETVPEGAWSRIRVLTPAERREAAARIDYVILSQRPVYLPGPGAVEAGLRANPALAGMRQGELLRFAMAPLPGDGTLDLAALQFDLLDLSLADAALAVPLAPDNRAPARNGFAGLDAAARAICPVVNGEPDGFCRGDLE